MLYLIPLFQNKPIRMTLVHAIQSFTLCLLSLTLISDFQSSYIVDITMINSFLYFVVDTVYDIIHGKLEILYLLHHLASAFAIYHSIPFKYECIVCLCLCEASNVLLPFVKSIMIVSDEVDKNNKEYIPSFLNNLYIVGPMFYLTFVISRFVIAPIFISNHVGFFDNLVFEIAILAFVSMYWCILMSIRVFSMLR